MNNREKMKKKEMYVSPPDFEVLLDFRQIKKLLICRVRFQSRYV